jgi:hypothetical protein
MQNVAPPLKTIMCGTTRQKILLQQLPHLVVVPQKIGYGCLVMHICSSHAAATFVQHVACSPTIIFSPFSSPMLQPPTAEYTPV